MRLSDSYQSRSRGWIVFVVLCACGFPACAVAAPTPKSPTSDQARISVVRTYPHDVTTFTEGLEVRGDVVYESSGLYGTSQIRTSSLRTGTVLARVDLPKTMFAEGLTLLPNGRIVQLSWKEKTAFVRNAKTLAETERLPYDEEGWGLCYSSAKKAFVHSDGTNKLRLRDPKTFAVKSTLTTKFADGQLPKLLNELECVGNTVYVNVWTTKTILQIDLSSGVVIRLIDATGIGPTAPTSPDDVLNGIALLPNGHFLLTGKRWPLSYEVQFVSLPT